MITALIFILVIGVLVLVHEFGHFIVAKRAGMKVEEFGFGFPPRLFGWKRGETTYSLNWIPFGGFVKILGEDGDDQGPRSFASKSIKTRLGVVLAGVIMNVLLAVVLLMIVNFFGLRIGLVDDELFKEARDHQIQVISIAADSPAQAADLRPLDQLIRIKAQEKVFELATSKEAQEIIKENAGKSLTLVIKRGNETVEKTVIPRLNPPEGQGALGISLAQTGVISYPWHEAIWRGFYNTGILLINTVIGYYLLLKTLLFEGRLLGEVSGPVGIATLTGQAARIGINYLLQFVALISINLAVLNSIPFPALDGGRAILLIVEKIKGSPVPKRAEGMINAVGFYLLILLMIYVTIKDVVKFF